MGAASDLLQSLFIHLAVATRGAVALRDALYICFSPAQSKLLQVKGLQGTFWGLFGGYRKKTSESSLNISLINYS